MKWYQFWIADYRKDTTHLSHEEHYIYRSLIDIYYETEKPIDSNLRPLLRRLGLTSDQQLLLENVLSDFFIDTEKGYKHPRIEEDLEKIYKKSFKARKSAEARWQKHANASKDDANALRTHSDGIDNECDRTPNASKTHPSTQNSVLSTQYSKQSKNQETGSKAANGRMKRPDPSEVQEYLDQLQETRFTGQQFCDSNIAKGWVVGKTKTPMKDWKATVRTWRTNRDKDNQPQHDFGKGGI